MSGMSLAQANRIIEAAFAEAAKLGLAPLAAVVVDAAGHCKAMQCQDGATFFRPRIARAKAWSAVALGAASRRLGEMAAERPAFMTALVGMAEGSMMPVPGGVLIRDAEGRLLGAAGISGDTSDRDEACAVAGIRAAALVPDAG